VWGEFHLDSHTLAKIGITPANRPQSSPNLEATSSILLFVIKALDFVTVPKPKVSPEKHHNMGLQSMLLYLLLVTHSASFLLTQRVNHRHILSTTHSRAATCAATASTSTSTSTSLGMIMSVPPPFRNDGKFKIVKDALDQSGILPRDGEEKQIFFGIFTKKSQNLPDKETRERLREEAALNLTNIDEEERKRRKLVGNSFLLLTYIIALLTTSGGSNDFIGNFVRCVSCSLPFALGYSYRESGRAGL